MWYFAYGSHLNATSIVEWAREQGLKTPQIKKPLPAVLENYRLCFPIYSEYWRGGIADIAYDPGKSVSGALYELTKEEIEVFDMKVGRKLENSKEVGTFKHLDVKVLPISKKTTVPAITYQGTRIEKYHIPPSQFYMDLVIQGAYASGLSMMWISYLQSFSTQTGKKPSGKRLSDPATGS